MLTTDADGALVMVFTGKTFCSYWDVWTPPSGRGTPIELAVTTVSRKDADQSAAEAFRKLRTNLQFMSVDSPPRVMVVTSPLPGDGKSVSAGNLAATIAASGSPVVLMDGDLRRPTVADNFGLLEGTGLTDVLIGVSRWMRCCSSTRPWSTCRAWLSAGCRPTAASCWDRKPCASCSKLSASAPPLLPVTDGAVLTAVTDGALAVVSAGKPLDSDLASAFGHLEAVHGKALGVVMNQVPVREISSPSSSYRRDAEAPVKKSLLALKT